MNHKKNTVQTESTPDLHLKIGAYIADQFGLLFIWEEEQEGNVCMINSHEVRAEYRQSFTSGDILNYIYAVLHDPACRDTYKASLTMDFPPVPYPKDTATFWALVALGGQLQSHHPNQVSAKTNLPP